MDMAVKTYGELQVGDVIWWYGAKERVVEVTEYPADPLTQQYPHRLIYFTVEPFDDEAEKINGKFYTHGRYGGNDDLTVVLAQ